jgi:hypothetical protein
MWKDVVMLIQLVASVVASNKNQNLRARIGTETGDPARAKLYVAGYVILVVTVIAATEFAVRATGETRDTLIAFAATGISGGFGLLVLQTCDDYRYLLKALPEKRQAIRRYTFWRAIQLVAASKFFVMVIYRRLVI